jgi:hypothetical protein
MAKDKRIGQCALCRRTPVELQRSHLLPAAISRWLRLKGRKNPNEISITNTKAIQMSHEVADYFLCYPCEQRFHQRGENWVLENAFRGGTKFPIRMMLLKGQPFQRLPSLDLYRGTGLGAIGIDSVCYFAASIFWRASARTWSLPGGQSCRLRLGPYEEQLRQYLFDEAPFPDRASLVVSVAKTASPLMSMSMPYSLRLEDFWQHRFLIPGLAFSLHLGKTLPPLMMELCSVHSPQRAICLSDKAEDAARNDAARMIQNARPVGTLARRYAPGENG